MIPNHAEIKYSREFLRVYEWKQVLFDESTTTFEVAVRKASVQVFVMHNNKLVYVQEEQPHKGDYLGIVGGMLNEWDEDPQEAAAREVEEETGFVGETKFLFTDSREGGFVNWQTHYYVLYVNGLGNKCLDAGERVEVQEIPIDDLLSLVRDKQFRNQDLRVILENKIQDGTYKEFISQLLRA
ncbi:MAG: NUDIX domain-containing protein [Candidatus Woesearchaeota archaeon]